MAVTAAITAVGAIGSLAAGAAASGAGSAAQARANQLRQQALKAYAEIMPPDYSQLYGEVAKLKEEGLIDPRTEMAIYDMDSENRTNTGHAQAVEAQKAALAHLQEVVQTEGLTAEDKAFYNKISDNLNQQERASRATVLANAQARGAADSGTALAAQLSAGQEAREQASNQALNLAAIAQGRKDQAALGAGQIGAQVRQQAMARDQLALAAKQQNYNNAMGAVQTATGLRQTEFWNQMDRAAGLAGQYGRQAASQERFGSQQAQRYGDMISGVAGAVGSGLSHATETGQLALSPRQKTASPTLVGERPPGWNAYVASLGVDNEELDY